MNFNQILYILWQAAEGRAESRRRYMTTWLIYIRTAAAVFGMSNTAADGVGRPNKLESSLSALLSFRPRGIYIGVCTESSCRYHGNFVTGRWPLPPRWFYLGAFKKKKQSDEPPPRPLIYVPTHDFSIGIRRSEIRFLSSRQ